MMNRIYATLSSFALLTAATAFAQSAVVMKADIPFEFRVGTTVLPAGHYSVRPQTAPNVLSIQCYECKAGAMILTNGVDATNFPSTARLVFRRYDNTYFLGKVWTPGYSQGRELRRSKAEREIAKNNSSPARIVEVSLVRP